MTSYRIAALPGDGIGPEVMAQALRVLTVVGERFALDFQVENGLIGGAAYDVHGEHLPSSTLELCREVDAILFGSVGGPVDAQSDPKWKNAEKTAILGLRKALRLNINLRPAVLYPFLSDLSPLRAELLESGVDLLVVRELIGGIYFGEHKTQGDRAHDVMTYSVDEIEPLMRLAFEAAQTRQQKVTVVDKANVLDCSRLWRRVAEDVSPDFPEVTLEYMYIDNAVMQLMKNPGQFDVVATSNLFGDIFSDAASVLPGSLGLMPSASLGEMVNLYEPIGGSAPDIAGRGIANPIAQILSVALMLRYSFSLEQEAAAIEGAVQQVLANGVRTGDICAKTAHPVRTAAMGDAIVDALLK